MSGPSTRPGRRAHLGLLMSYFESVTVAGLSGDSVCSEFMCRTKLYESASISPFHEEIDNDLLGFELWDIP